MAPAQVAAAVASATGTGEGPALQVENSANAVDTSPVAGALSQQTVSESKEQRSSSTTQTAVTENVDYQNKVSLRQRTGLNNDTVTWTG